MTRVVNRIKGLLDVQGGGAADKEDNEYATATWFIRCRQRRDALLSPACS